MAEYYPSKRAQRVWTRLMETYGASFAEQYGTKKPDGSVVIPPDWSSVVDAADNDSVKAALVAVRAEHVKYPPNLAQFEAIFEKLKKPIAAAGPSVMDKLTDWVLANKPLTVAQLRMPWKYLGDQFDSPDIGGKIRAKHGVNITGVVVPADGKAPGYRVMVSDMSMSAVTKPEFDDDQPRRLSMDELIHGDWGKMDTRQHT